MSPSERSDSELVANAKTRPWEAGGRESLGDLWAKHQPWIIGRISRRHDFAPPGCSREEFEKRVLERVQERFVTRVLRYRGTGPLQAFLATIIDRAAIDEYRSGARRPWEENVAEMLPREATGSRTEEEQLGRLTVGSHARSSIPEPILMDERSKKIRALLERLAAESREGLKWAKALRRHYWENRTQKEIAEEHSVDERTVIRWLQNGRKRMKELLRDRYGVNDLEDL